MPRSLTAGSTSSAACDGLEDSSLTDDPGESSSLGRAETCAIEPSSMKRIYCDANAARVKPAESFSAAINLRFNIMIWRLDALRMSFERIISLFHRTAVGNCREKRWKKHEASK